MLSQAADAQEGYDDQEDDDKNPGVRNHQHQAESPVTPHRPPSLDLTPPFTAGSPVQSCVGQTHRRTVPRGTGPGLTLRGRRRTQTAPAGTLGNSCSHSI